MAEYTATIDMLGRRYAQMARAIGATHEDNVHIPRARLAEYTQQWCYGDEKTQIGAVTRNFPFIPKETQELLSKSTVIVLGKSPTLPSSFARLGVGLQRMYCDGITFERADEVLRIMPLAGALVSRNVDTDERRKALLNGRPKDGRPEKERRGCLVVETDPLNQNAFEIAKAAVSEQIPYLLLLNYGTGVTAYFLDGRNTVEDVVTLFRTLAHYRLKDKQSVLSPLSPIGDLLSSALAMTYVVKILTSPTLQEKAYIGGEFRRYPQYVDINLLDSVLQHTVGTYTFLRKWLAFSEDLSNQKILIAGLGAGSPVAYLLATLGFPLRVADPGSYGRENLSRQLMYIDDINAPKVQTFRRHHPNGTIEIVPEGITPTNIQTLAEGCVMAIEMVDIAHPALILQMHQALRRLGIVSLTGLDAGWTSVIHRYNATHTLEHCLQIPIDTLPQTLDNMDPIGIIMTQIGNDAPPELQLAVDAFAAGHITYGPQLGATGFTIGALQAIAIIGQLMGFPIKDTFSLSTMSTIKHQ